MVIKVYVSGMSGNKEVKKRQQRVTMIMDSKHIEYTVIDITEPGQEAEKDFMQTNAQHKGCTISDPNPRHALPPQLFNDTEYCGDYDDFDMANEVDNLEVFLKLAAPAPEVVEHKNGEDTTTTTTEATADDEDKENKTEDNTDGGAEVAAETGTNEEPPSASEMEADDEEQELLKTSAALAGKSEDAEEIEIEEAAAEDEEEEEEEEIDPQPAEDDAGEIGISSKLVDDTDDPMLAEQEQEE